LITRYSCFVTNPFEFISEKLSDALNVNVEGREDNVIVCPIGTPVKMDVPDPTEYVPAVVLLL
jgi:hypothetical protein